jgi:hypothetical protein
MINSCSNKLTNAVFTIFRLFFFQLLITYQARGSLWEYQIIQKGSLYYLRFPILVKTCHSSIIIKYSIELNLRHYIIILT